MIHNHILQSRLRFPELEGLGSRIDIPQEQGKLYTYLWASSTSPLTQANYLFFVIPSYLQSVLSTFSKLCKNIYTVACRRVLTSTALYVVGSKPLVAFENKKQTKP
jgi:hypothetical protein